MSSWVDDKPVKVRADELETETTRRERRHIAKLIERADYLSVKMRVRAGRNLPTRFLLEEFDAIVWALTRIAGAEVVNRWMGVIDKAPGTLDHFDEHTPSTMKQELPPEEPST